MADYAAFDPTDPLEQLADAARREIADIGLRYLAERPGAQTDDFQYLVIGLLTGVAGIAIAHFQQDDEAHHELRAWLTSCVPQAFDQARGILDMPPMPEVN